MIQEIKNNLQIIIPHIARNNELLKINIPYIQANLSPKEIVILSKKDTIDTISKEYVDYSNIVFLDEDSIYPNLTFSRIKELLSKTKCEEDKTGWYFQQFLKFAWSFNPKAADYYLTWDSDTIPLQKISFFSDDGKPYFLKKYEYNPSYFQTLEKLLGLKKENNFSFIAESMLFSKKIVKELIETIEKNKELSGLTFYEKILSLIDYADKPRKAFSEFETYGTYVSKYYPDLYITKEIKAFRMGARRYGLNPTHYDLKRESKKYETISFERWNKIIPLYNNLQHLLSKTIFRG